MGILDVFRSLEDKLKILRYKAKKANHLMHKINDEIVRLIETDQVGSGRFKRLKSKQKQVSRMLLGYQRQIDVLERKMGIRK